MNEKAKAARREYARQYRAANRERVREAQKRWRRKNPEKVAAIQARYWEKRAEIEAGGGKA